MPSMARLQPQSQLSLFIFHHSHVFPSLGHLLISFFLCSYFPTSRVFLHNSVASAIRVIIKEGIRKHHTLDLNNAHIILQLLKHCRLSSFT